MSFFIACGSSAPVTEINPLVLKETEALVIKTPTPDSIQKKDSVVKPDSLIIPIDTSTLSVDSIIEEKKLVVNPYRDIPALVQEVLKYADTLLSKGKSDSAAAYLEQFIVLKPLWDEWQKEAQNIYLRTKKTQAMRAEEFKSLTLQIINMNSVGASYDLIKTFTDSLVSLNPGDSLISWVEKQNKIAFQKNLSKARQEKEIILAEANKSNQFKTAQEQITQLKARYYYFEDSLQLESTIAQLVEMENSISKQDELFWESNDPNKSLEQAEKWIAEKKYSKARTLLQKLKSSILRQKAIEQMEVLAEAFCNEERKKTSVLFQSAQKTSNDTQKKKKLTQAIEGLNRCLDQYPEYSQKEKVINNRDFLENELSR
jgi:hypothetical protein